MKLLRKSCVKAPLGDQALIYLIQLPRYECSISGNSTYLFGVHLEREPKRRILSKSRMNPRASKFYDSALTYGNCSSSMISIK